MAGETAILAYPWAQDHGGLLEPIPAVMGEGRVTPWTSLQFITVYGKMCALIFQMWANNTVNDIVIYKCRQERSSVLLQGATVLIRCNTSRQTMKHLFKT